MELKLIKRGLCLITEPNGELDHHAAAILSKKTDSALLRSGAKHIIFDMSHVDFMDSSGIGMLLGRYKKLRETGGLLILCGVSENIMRIIMISGLQKLLPIAKDIPGAIRITKEAN
ncbi:MAG: anti-sigma factor antagonist [Firmicutes bacterium]|nr:anti-sigma factor antagonist [Bacillota bacterium]